MEKPATLKNIKKPLARRTRALVLLGKGHSLDEAAQIIRDRYHPRTSVDAVKKRYFPEKGPYGFFSKLEGAKKEEIQQAFLRLKATINSLKSQGEPGEPYDKQLPSQAEYLKHVEQTQKKIKEWNLAFNDLVGENKLSENAIQTKYFLAIIKKKAPKEALLSIIKTGFSKTIENKLFVPKTLSFEAIGQILAKLHKANPKHHLTAIKDLHEHVNELKKLFPTETDYSTLFNELSIKTKGRLPNDIRKAIVDKHNFYLKPILSFEDALPSIASLVQEVKASQAEGKNHENNEEYARETRLMFKKYFFGDPKKKDEK